MDKICVARDEECGVYGFVFFRDGEWISTVVSTVFPLLQFAVFAFCSVPERIALKHIAGD